MTCEASLAGVFGAGVESAVVGEVAAVEVVGVLLTHFESLTLVNCVYLEFVGMWEFEMVGEGMDG